MRKKTKLRVALSPNGKFNAPLLTHMREVAFGDKTTEAINATLSHAEGPEASEARLAAAEAKRARKAAKNRGLA